MRRLDIAIAVWGDAYVDTLLTWALPSFLAPGNLPACAALLPLRTMIVTRPEDEQTICVHPVARELQRIGELQVLPLLTPDRFVGANRYEVMAFGHRQCIAQSLADGAIITLLSPDCVVANGSLAFGLQRILAGKSAVLIAGPRAILEDVASLLPPYRVNEEGTAVSISSRDLASMATLHPHAISRLLYWDAEPFSQFPSAIYWRAGEDSFLARYFHLHPLFVDLASADRDAAKSGTIDGSLLALAKIGRPQIDVIEDSANICVVELSSSKHDPMGSLPQRVANKTLFIAKWAIAATVASHRAQFKQHFFRFQGRGSVDWDEVVARSKRNTAVLDVLLNYLDLISHLTDARRRVTARSKGTSASIRKIIRRLLLKLGRALRA
jgi:hypothetical protein